MENTLPGGDAAMSENHIGLYIPGQSFMHRLDPRTKWVITLLVAVDVYRIHTFLALLPLFLLVVLGLVLSQTRLHAVGKALRPVLPLMMLFALVHLFFDTGQPWLQAGPFLVTREGLYMAGLTFLQFALLFLAAALLSWTTSPLELARGLEQLFSPLKRVGVPVHAFAMSISLAWRFFPILSREWNRIKIAQVSRGADLEHGSFPRRMRHLAALVIPLLIHTFERAEELAAAMDARAYRGDHGRTPSPSSPLKLGDLGALLIAVGLSISLFWLPNT
jgi:energy-coupling factor transport system permease protein